MTDYGNHGADRQQHIAGTLTVNEGTLITLGTNIFAAVPIVGNTAGLNAALNIAGGGFQANNNGGQMYSTSLTIGNVAGSAGDAPTLRLGVTSNANPVKPLSCRPSGTEFNQTSAESQPRRNGQHPCPSD